ncbi:hypothetical protein HMPREF9306_02037 [Propionimicrobium lymphophilum ACS-093-V-SCH5]|uniref:Uncharacterized protein n=1 Tax=Propionimicrobium lymphophilum ACS-093-V-SCH5 TaxID=883161 RepID=S2W006_9ACTN|nr:hypothetical protein HMPREF9306_02037 [Propionimicrobium lymphophilum ACS-093-V-SCH5]
MGPGFESLWAHGFDSDANPIRTWGVTENYFASTSSVNGVSILIFFQLGFALSQACGPNRLV